MASISVRTWAPSALWSSGFSRSRTLGAAGGQFQRLAHQRQGDFRLPAKLAADDPRGDGGGQAHRAGFPVREPRLLGLLQIGGGLSQGRQRRRHLLGHHLLDFLHGRLAPFARPPAGGWRRPGPGPGRRSRRPRARTWSRHWPAWASEVVEVERHRVRAVGRVGGSDDGGHRQTAAPRRSGGQVRSSAACGTTGRWANAAICRRASSTSLRRIGPG